MMVNDKAASLIALTKSQSQIISDKVEAKAGNRLKTSCTEFV